MVRNQLLLDFAVRCGARWLQYGTAATLPEEYRKNVFDALIEYHGRGRVTRHVAKISLVITRIERDIQDQLPIRA